MQGLPGTNNAHRILLGLSIFISLVGILLPKFNFGGHEILTLEDTALLPSSQFKARGITPELYLDGVPIAEVQPRFNPIDDFLFFSHIPRTAGGTFSILLNSLFPDEEQVPHSGSGSAVRDLDSYLALTPEEWKPYRVLYSHEDFSFVRLIPKRVAITVFLRDPVKHRRSAYYWGLLTPFRKYDDISSWVVSPDFPPYYQVEWVAGVSRWWPYSHYSEEYSLRVWNNKALLMRLAKENLAATTWFGITERFNESVCLFYYTHRLPPKVEGKDYRSIHRYVTGGGSEGVVATAEDLQRPRLAYEYEFIRWAEKLFELRLANMKDDYRAHRKIMQQYVAPECIGVLT